MSIPVTPAKAGAQTAANSSRFATFLLCWVPAFAGMTMLTITACAPSKLAYGQVKSAMLNAGLSEGNSSCMATRLTDRLSLLQLNKLRKLKGQKRSLFDYAAAVRQVGDTEVIEVTASSAALCASGFAPEKK